MAQSCLRCPFNRMEILDWHFSYADTITLYEPRYEKTGFCICENKAAFVSYMYIRIVQSLHYLNPKCQASSYRLRLYSPVCVGPGRKARGPVFKQQCSIWPENSRICATLRKPIENSYRLITFTKYYHFVLRSILYRHCKTGHIKGRNPHNLTD